MVGCGYVQFDPITVLLLEDDPDVLDATTMVLEDEGFRVLAAENLDAAVELARGLSHCVILLDLSLDGDALQFVKALHALPDWDGQVLVFSAGDRLEERALAIGADGAVPKPFDIDRLVAELRNRTGHRGAFSPAS